MSIGRFQALPNEYILNLFSYLPGDAQWNMYRANSFFARFNSTIEKVHSLRKGLFTIQKLESQASFSSIKNINEDQVILSSFEKMQVLDLKKNELCFSISLKHPVFCFHESGGNIYIGTSTRSLLIVNSKNQSSEEIKVGSADNFFFPCIHCFSQINNDLYCGLGIGGVIVFDLKTQQFTHTFRLPFETDKSEMVTLCILDNKLYALSKMGNVHCWDLKSKDYLEKKGSNVHSMLLNNDCLILLMSGEHIPHMSSENQIENEYFVHETQNTIEIWNLKLLKRMDVVKKPLHCSSMWIRENHTICYNWSQHDIKILNFCASEDALLQLADKLKYKESDEDVDHFKRLPQRIQQAVYREFRDIYPFKETIFFDKFSPFLRDLAIYRYLLKQVAGYLESKDSKEALDLFQKLPNAVKKSIQAVDIESINAFLKKGTTGWFDQ